MAGYAASSTTSRSSAGSSCGRRMRGIMSESNDPNATTTAPTQIAGPKPSTKVCGDS
jgi:hypothetical protein